MSVHVRGYYLECDECGEQFDPERGDEVTDVQAVLDEAVEAGWSIYGEDEHFCPDCKKSDG